MSWLRGTNDTIVAAVTPPGKGGIAVIRISGERSKELAAAFVEGPLPKPGRLERRILVTPDRREPLDEAMVVFFPAPHTYTGEHVVELHLHGSPVLVSFVLSTLVSLGARHARPGEFTLRAFLNGKKDLTRAEAVHDLVCARSVPGLKDAAKRLAGAALKEIEGLADALLEVISHLEAEIDFPDDVDELPLDQLNTRLKEILVRMNRLVESYQVSRVLKEGFRVVLAGAPNAGKSSLFNALLGRTRAVVSQEPGTTRDFLEEFLPDSKVPVLLTDTAGFRESASPAERAGVEFTRQLICDAHLVLHVRDCTAAETPEDLTLENLCSGRKLIKVWTKYDLITTGIPHEQSTEALPSALPAPSPIKSEGTGKPMASSEQVGSRDSHHQTNRVEALSVGTNGQATLDVQAGKGIMVSSVTGQGIQQLREMLQAVAEEEVPAGIGATLSSERQRNGVAAAAGVLRETLEALAELPRDILAGSLRQSLVHLNEVTGRAPVTEQILEQIFSRFCIGK